MISGVSGPAVWGVLQGRDRKSRSLGTRALNAAHALSDEDYVFVSTSAGWKLDSAGTEIDLDRDKRAAFAALAAWGTEIDGLGCLAVPAPCRPPPPLPRTWPYSTTPHSQLT